MKVQLIVVRGKPEGKVIPLVGSKFKIGRGETCHLRPNSEQVSREHAEFTIIQGVVAVADLGSRNGTLVNGKALTAGPCPLKDRDLVQVGPLTFAVSIQDAPAAVAEAKPAAPKASPAAQETSPAAAQAPAPTPAPAAKTPGKSAKSAPEEVLNEEIDAWLVGEATASNPDVPTTVYGGDTITIAAFKDAAEAASAPAKPAPIPLEESPEEEEEEAEEVEEEEEEVLMDTLDEEEDEEEEAGEEDAESEAVEEFVDESNPFYAAKKAQQQASKATSGGATGAGGANQQFKDTSDAATEILRKLMEKRRASK
ncbi:FHA domain-containing protein [Planctomyces sp. SH-PL62]|uniref:FHA domain-containing protein n=1 Tax=Planctomyces sp. SH-PL62 TaxID=1636152 RepID=UPI00078B4056|nr:FHA domain-containing protein [Planctomyces sp. SH-PL62]AMV39050.1 FHA domain protein [Planctomyces sp. SH-PL62]